MSKPTLEQQLNLLKLAKGLASLPDDYDHFDMSYFFMFVRGRINFAEPDEVRRKHYNECGTVACAVGHGPYFGIPCHKGDFGWGGYCERVFGVSVQNRTKDFDYMFAGGWARTNSGHTDNTPRGAAARIVTYLTNNCEVPEDWNAYKEVYL